MTPHQALSKYFGYEEFRQNQLDIIESIIAGENILAVLPTGAGKSLCYQIPALISNSFSIVISPLIALMKDQVDALNKVDEIAAFINSSQSYIEIESIIQKLSHGKIKLLYVAPERLSNQDFLERIKNLHPSFLFIDEAHCISEWGHNFRPSYRKINEFAKFISIKRISSFTATATPEVVNDILGQLELREPRLFIRGFERDNLELNTIITKNKKAKCLELIFQYKSPAIIYTSSRKMTEELSTFLNMNRINAAFYHAGMNPLARKKIQDDFISDRINIIIATNAFGMGIDKKNIRLIIHYNTPGSIENYYQEIGRAGRDGKTSYAFLLYDDEDINIQNYFLLSSHPDKQLIENIYNAICDYGKIAIGNTSDKEIPINYEFISAVAKKNINKGLLHSAIKFLEEGGYLKLVSEFDRKPQVQFNVNKNQLKDFIKNTPSPIVRDLTLQLIRNFGITIFDESTRLSIKDLADDLDTNETEIEGALAILENLGFIEYRRPSIKESAVLITQRVGINQLRLDYKRINESFLNLQKKIQSMVDFVFSKNCRFKFILNYFGEDTTVYKCGKCDNCRESYQYTELNSDYLKENILTTLHLSEHPVSEKAIISLLRGENSVNQNKTILNYGICSNYNQNELKIAIKELIERDFIEKKNGIKTKLILSTKGKSYLMQNGFVEDIPVIEDYETSLELFNLLRDARANAARKFLQTSYLICPDEVLRSISQQKPISKRDILSIPGFNDRMFNKIGNDFLEIINSFINSKEKSAPKEPVKKEMPNNIIATLNLVQKKYSIKDISIMRQLSEAVISMQIESIIEFNPDLDISYLYKEGQLNLILCEIDKGYIDLKELKSKLPKDISYPMIRIAVSKSKSNSSLVYANPRHA